MAEFLEVDKPKLKIKVLPLNDWYIVKIWDGRYQGKDMDQEEKEV